MKRILVGRLFLVALLGLNGVAFAGGFQPYSEKEVARISQEGNAVVLAFHSASCGTCKKQSALLDSLLKEEAMSSVTVLRVDFDEASDLNKKYKVNSPSTIVVVQNGKEIARSIGETNSDNLRNLLSKGA